MAYGQGDVHCIKYLFVGDKVEIGGVKDNDGKEGSRKITNWVTLRWNLGDGTMRGSGELGHGRSKTWVARLVVLTHLQEA